jgi:beta-galactosidase/beta-glucuronidase
MVLQNYNHPSIVFWSVGNETGFLRVNRYAAVVKQADPHRIVAYASNVGTKGKRFYRTWTSSRRTRTAGGTSASRGSSSRRP